MPNAIVTGANRGIGLALCKALSARDYDVTALCRKSSKELDALSVNVYEGYDVSDTNAVNAFAESVAANSVDLLINNAGVMQGTFLNNLDGESLHFQFEVNAVGPLRVTSSLIPKLKKGAKVAMITSRMGSMADNDSGGSYGYRMSKAALNAAGVSLSVDLHPKGISVALLHPGWVKTDMTGSSAMIDTDESAAGLLERIDQLNLDNSGTFWHMNGEVLPW